jgi:hypothetical protein
MIHSRIAAALSEAAQLDGTLYGDLVHHAGFAEDYVLAARACVAAGDRCLRMFANSEAEEVADRGLLCLQHMASGAERTQLQIALFNIKVQGAFHLFAAAKPSKSQTTELLNEIRRAADEAEVMGLSEDAALAHNSIAWLTWRSNESETAHAATLEAERTSRTADGVTRCQHLANTGRCLLDVEADIERARRFVNEAASLAAVLNLHLVELEWGLGLIARWEGDLDRAYGHTSRAAKLARMQENRWREIECLLWLAKIDLELQNYNRVIVHCDAMMSLADRIGGAHAPIAKALRFLAEQRTCFRNWEISKYVVELRNFDDKANLAYFLNECAIFELEHCAAKQAQAHAREALAAASSVRRPTEVAVAHAILLRIAHADGNKDEVAKHVSNLASVGNPQHLSARARLQIEFALSFLRGVSTLVQTHRS